jgi:hypothetical protein
MLRPRASCTSIIRIRSLLIGAWTRRQRRRSRNRALRFRVPFLNHLIPKPGAVTTLISLAIIDSHKLCMLPLSGGFCFAPPAHGARRSGPLTPRLEWQDERRSFCFPPPVGAGIHSRSVKGARIWNQRTLSLSTHWTFSLSSDRPSDISVYSGNPCSSAAS